MKEEGEEKVVLTTSTTDTTSMEHNDDTNNNKINKSSSSTSSPLPLTEQPEQPEQPPQVTTKADTIILTSSTTTAVKNEDEVITAGGSSSISIDSQSTKSNSKSSPTDSNYHSKNKRMLVGIFIGLLVIIVVVIGATVGTLVVGKNATNNDNNTSNTEQMVQSSSSSSKNVTTTSTTTTTTDGNNNDKVEDDNVSSPVATKPMKTTKKTSAPIPIPVPEPTTKPTKDTIVVVIDSDDKVTAPTMTPVAVEPIYINAGGGTITTTMMMITTDTTSSTTTPSTIVWSEDIYYNGGREAKNSNCMDNDSQSTVVTIEEEQGIGCTYRIFRDSDTNGNKTYTIPVPIVGIMYTIRFYFVEVYYTQPYQRVFDISLEDGNVTIFNVDIIAQQQQLLSTTAASSSSSSTTTTNGGFLYVAEATVPVNDGILSIDFVPKTSFPIVSGIEITAASVTTPASSPTATTTGNSTTTDATTGSTTTAPSTTDNSTDTTSTGTNTTNTNTTTTTTTTTTTDSGNSTTTPSIVTYTPGLLTTTENGLLLSDGLTAKIIATSGNLVQYYDGTTSNEPFHSDPDYGTTYIDTRSNNVGGWIYVSNSEVRPKNGIKNKGGVGAITFNKDGNVIHYQTILSGTTSNCGGGKTPWDSYISCEEYGRGEIYQVDPYGVRPSTKITMGSSNPGLFESFAYDVRDQQQPHFYVTKDDENGELTRFTPNNPDWNDPWTMLLTNGTIEYLVVTPDSTTDAADQQGTYYWTTDLSVGQNTATRYFPHCEGIDVYKNELFFVSKKFKLMFILELDSNTYKAYKTTSGLFAGQPDQIVRLISQPEVDNDDTATTTNTIKEEPILYFTEDGGTIAGVHGRNQLGQYYTIFENNGMYADETTGLSFSPNGVHMYIAYQDNGILFDISRTDGLPFYGKTLNVKYHSLERN